MAKSGMSDSKEESSPSETVVAGAETPAEPQRFDILGMCDVISKPFKVKTQVSILIESLVKSLCDIYEPDSMKRKLVYSDICDRLFQLNLIDESYNMTEFEPMRMEYQMRFQKMLEAGVGGGQPVALCPVLPLGDYENSHYYREFDELDYIAGGGFGQVFRVQNKLDGVQYAMKKIPIRAEGIESVRRYLSEVKTFANANHSNIVAYKAAWLEPGPPGPTTATIIDAEETSTSYATSEPTGHLDDELMYHQDEELEFVDREESSTDFEVSFGHSPNSTMVVLNAASNSTSRQRRKRHKRSSTSEGGRAICRLDMKEMRALHHRTHVKWATLYVQMALCQMTLKQWLEARNDAEKIAMEHNDNNKLLAVPVQSHLRNETIGEVLKQLLQGLEYIHSKGIVHHDIKPSNIFIQRENDRILVQLGDFGLACPLQNVRHRLAFGTPLYAAPEQLAGKCDRKSDIYSLGIVLLELVERFRTDMERVDRISRLRKGELPPHLTAQQPQLAHIIAQLVLPEPQHRPDASTLLETLSDSTSDAYTRELESKLAEQKSQLEKRDEEIDRLKELLKTAGVKGI